MPEAIVEVDFFDTTLRDGAQALPDGHQFPDGSKPEIASFVASLGFNTIEAGFPANKRDFEEVRTTAETVGQDKIQVEVWHQGVKCDEVLTTPEIAGLGRACPEDIDATWEAISPASRARIHLFAPTDDRHIDTKFTGATHEDVIAMIRSGAAYAKLIQTSHPSATVEFSPEIATSSNPDFLERSIKTAVDEGADIINVPDTRGQRDPFWMYQFYRRIIRGVMAINPDVVISAHNHNDMGMAVANSMALVRAASDHAAQHSGRIKTQIETTITGMGERAGNADIFPIVASLHQLADELPAAVTWRFNPGQAVRVAEAVLGYTNSSIPHRSPIVGSGVNRHLSGVHSDAIVKGGADGYELYTPFDPVFWGHRKQAVFEDGKYQGKKGREAAQQQIDITKSKG